MLPAAALIAADSVRRLSVAMVLFTSSFTKTLTPGEIERVHDEVAEFHAFYLSAAAGDVDFEFALVQADRRLGRHEMAEVSPDRFYLARDAVEPELAARGFRGRFDEVIVLHAWTNANPERALQAYGGGAVGPDGRFLGDAGYNSIPVMGRDPGTIGQVLVHEVLHNLDDMFSRSGMPDAFLNADEMSRNMPLLLRERPGAFLPLYSDPEMLDYARRERQGREAYPWAMQLVYYRWMLERVPRSDWDRLRYGRMVPWEAEPEGRPLYSAIYTSVANDRVYVPVLGAGAVTVRGARLEPRTWVQTDFDGSPLASGAYHAGWVALPDTGRDTLVLGLSGAAGVTVVRQRLASVAAPESFTRYLESPAPLEPRVLVDRCCGDGPPLPGAAVRAAGGDPAELGPGSYRLTFTSQAPRWYVHPARTTLEVRREWRVNGGGPTVVSPGAPATIVAEVRRDRARDDARVTATLLGRTVPLRPLGQGRYAVTIDRELPWGTHWARIEARSPEGTSVSDSLMVYVRPGGWIRVGDTLFRGPGGRVRVAATLVGRLGEEVREAQLPLVAIVNDLVTALGWDPLASRYEALMWTPPGTDRVVVASLLGDSQRRSVSVIEGAGEADRGPTRPVPQPPWAAAIRLVNPPVMDGDPGEWPATRAPHVSIGDAGSVLTEPGSHHGEEDLSGSIRFAWDDSTLYVAGELTDEEVTTGEAWSTDRVNLVFDMRDDTSPVTYTTANPTLDRWQEDDYWVFWRAGSEVIQRFGRVNADPVPGARLATRLTPRGWSFEAAIPAAQLPGYMPFVGQVAGLQVFVTDGDARGAVSELMWAGRWPYTADGIEWRLAELGRLLFVGAPGP